MNVFLFEMRQQLRSLVSDCAIMALIAVALLALCYPVYSDAKTQAEALLASYPPEFLITFGINDDIFTFAGFFGFSYLYLSLTAAIMAAAWGLSVFGRESRSRCESFLLSKPRSRASVFAAKLAACLACIAVLTIVTVVACLASQQIVSADEVDAGRVALAALGLTGLELVFMSVGAAIACLARRIRSISGVATALGIGGFVLSSLPSLLDEEVLKFASPFSWFDPMLIFREGSFNAEHLAMAAAVVVVFLAVSFVCSTRRDARAA